MPTTVAEATCAALVVLPAATATADEVEIGKVHRTRRTRKHVEVISETGALIVSEIEARGFTYR